MRQRLSVLASSAVLAAGLTLAAQSRDAVPAASHLPWRHRRRDARRARLATPTTRSTSGSIRRRATLTASEHIVWRNITANPTSELQFHVYWNAWRDTKSTFLRERALVAADRHADDDFARIDITSLSYRAGVGRRRASGRST